MPTDQTKPGELFICRVIGNVVPPYSDAIGGVSATIEYAVGVLRVPRVIVCGHTDCGVIRGALYPQGAARLSEVAGPHGTCGDPFVYRPGAPFRNYSQS